MILAMPCCLFYSTHCLLSNELLNVSFILCTTVYLVGKDSLKMNIAVYLGCMFSLTGQSVVSCCRV